MSPKKWQESLKVTAEEFQIPEDLLKLLITYYWKKVRKELAEINSTRVEISGLGVFDLKYWKVKYKLRDTKAFIRYHEKRTDEKSIAILHTLNRKLAVFEKANELAEERATTKVIKRNARKKYILEKHGRLEATPKNMGGIVEQPVSEPIREQSGETPLRDLPA